MIWRRQVGVIASFLAGFVLAGCATVRIPDNQSCVPHLTKPLTLEVKVFEDQGFQKPRSKDPTLQKVFTIAFDKVMGNAVEHATKGANREDINRLEVELYFKLNYLNYPPRQVYFRAFLLSNNGKRLVVQADKPFSLLYGEQVMSYWAGQIAAEELLKSLCRPSRVPS